MEKGIVILGTMLAGSLIGNIYQADKISTLQKENASLTITVEKSMMLNDAYSALADGMLKDIKKLKGKLKEKENKEKEINKK